MLLDLHLHHIDLWFYNFRLPQKHIEIAYSALAIMFLHLQNALPKLGTQWLNSRRLEKSGRKQRSPAWLSSQTLSFLPHPCPAMLLFQNVSEPRSHQGAPSEETEELGNNLEVLSRGLWIGLHDLLIGVL